ncbi:MAG: DUF4376 domain-containing protein [Proteobacteria bacterium]|nr:DUF4376 domain-containing protein [Pseudomonadota bacterium]
MTQEEIDALKAQGYHFKATPEGEVRFTPEEETEWAAWQTAQVPTLAELKTSKLAALAALRWEKTLKMSYTFGGVTYTDVPAETATVAVMGTIVGAQLLAPDEPFVWKLKDGVFLSWYVADVQAYGLAIRAHIQACFNREIELVTAINAASDQAALDAIDITAGWPA